MELVELPDPEPGDGEVVVEVARAGRQLRRHPRDPQRLPRQADAAADPRRRDQRHARRTGRRVAAMLADGGYAEKVVVPEALAGPGPRRGLRRPGRGAPAPGADRARARPPLRAARGGRDGRRRGRRRRHRHARGPARQARRRAGDRARLERGEARAGRAARRRRDGRLARRGPRRGDPRGQRRQARSTPCFEMSRRRGLRGHALRTLAPFGRMVTFGIASREQNEVADRAPDAPLTRRDRLLADAPDPAPRRGRGDDRRPARRGRRGRARGRGRRRLPALRGAPRARGRWPARRTTGKLLLDPTT